MKENTTITTLSNLDFSDIDALVAFFEDFFDPKGTPWKIWEESTPHEKSMTWGKILDAFCDHGFFPNMNCDEESAADRPKSREYFLQKSNYVDLQGWLIGQALGAGEILTEQNLAWRVYEVQEQFASIAKSLKNDFQQAT